MIRRILMFKFKADANANTISTVLSNMESLPNKIDGITSVESGTDLSPEGMNKGFTHIVEFTFKDKEARDFYLPHPEHEAIKQLCMPILEDMLIFDYFV